VLQAIFDPRCLLMTDNCGKKQLLDFRRRMFPKKLTALEMPGETASQQRRPYIAVSIDGITHHQKLTTGVISVC